MCVSKPKIPAPVAVIERQPYKSPVSRSSLSSGDSEQRRRMIAGVATSATGVAEAASTTKRVRAGGDQPIMPVLTSGGQTPITPVIQPIVPIAPVVGPQSGARSRGTRPAGLMGYAGSLNRNNLSRAQTRVV